MIDLLQVPPDESEGWPEKPTSIMRKKSVEHKKTYHCDFRRLGPTQRLPPHADCTLIVPSFKMLSLGTLETHTCQPQFSPPRSVTLLMDVTVTCSAISCRASLTAYSTVHVSWTIIRWVAGGCKLPLGHIYARQWRGVPPMTCCRSYIPHHLQLPKCCSALLFLCFR